VILIESFILLLINISMMAVTATPSDCMFLIIDNNLPISVDNFFDLNSV